MLAFYKKNIYRLEVSGHILRKQVSFQIMFFFVKLLKELRNNRHTCGIRLMQNNKT